MKKFTLLQPLLDLPTGSQLTLDGDSAQLTIYPAAHPRWFAEFKRSTIGSRLKAAREEARFEVDELAEKCGIAASTLYRYERETDEYNLRNVSALVLKVYEETSQKPATYFIKGE